MKKGRIVPPECCVIIEIEQGASLGYRKAVLLNEIDTLNSLEKAAKTSRMNASHARDIIFEMNQDFSQPLIIFHGNPYDCDMVQLTARGKEVSRSYWQQFEPVWLSIIDERNRHY
jgi:molybdenum-dependent DNA-binding transcriptional regulator ModE